MVIKRQKQYSFGSKVLAVLSPGAWNAKELCKLQSADELEYRKNRWKAVIKGFLAPWSARNKLKRAQELYRSGADSNVIKENTKLTTGRAILGGLANATTQGLTGAIGTTLATSRGLRTKYGKNLKETRVTFGNDNGGGDGSY